MRLRGDDADALSRGSLVVEVGEHARATVVVEYTGAASYAEQLSVLVGDGASLELISLREWDAEHGQRRARRRPARP